MIEHEGAKTHDVFAPSFYRFLKTRQTTPQGKNVCGSFSESRTPKTFSFFQTVV
jgi:hypothetical protein